MSEEKFSKCGEGEKCKCRISGVRKKNGNWKKSSGKKNQNVFDGNLKWKILLSSCSLVGLYVCLQVKVTGKKMLKIFKVCSGWVFEVKFAICLGNLKLKKWNLNLLWKRNVLQISKKSLWVWVTPLVGRHVVNEPKVGCHVVNELEIS